MSHVTYKIVQHDGGWAYTVDGVFSESFSTHAAALAAAKRAAAEQRVPGTHRGDRIRDRRRQMAHRDRRRQRPSRDRCRGLRLTRAHRANAALRARIMH